MRVLCSVVCLVLLASLTGCPAPTGSPPSMDRPAVPTLPGEPPTVPILRLETGMHTAAIRHIGVDMAQRYLVTGSEDKTIRVWELASGRLLRTLRPPIGTGNEGAISAVALSPDDSTIAAGGFTDPQGEDKSVYLFDRASGRLRRRLAGLPNVILHLAYSRDGAFLVATLSSTHGIRVYRSSDGVEVARDTEYKD